MEAIIKKLKFKDAGVILHAPAVIEAAFVQRSFRTSLDKKGANVNTLVFITDHKTLMHFLTKNLKNIEPDSVLWFAYPKGTSGVKTDINRDTIRVTAEGFGITTVTAVSIDDTWSALRFRPIGRVGK